MLKKLIVILIMFVGVIVAGILESHYVSNTFDELEDKLITVRVNIEACGENINTEQNIADMKKIHADWKEKTKILKLYVWHTGIKDVEVGLSRITSYTEENDSTEAYVELNNLIDYSAHYGEDYKFNIQNII